MDQQGKITIEDVSEAEFNRVFALIKEIGEEERHFNELNAKYKTMASTWLLSVFAGIGYILVNHIEPTYLYIAVVGLAGSIGIMLLWIIDLRVYQKLLSANYTVGVQLEQCYPWLPPVRANMAKTQRTGEVVSNLLWYYLLGILFPLYVFAFALIKHYEEISLVLSITMAIGLAGLISGVAFAIIKLSIKRRLSSFAVKPAGNKIVLGKAITFGLFFLLGYLLLNTNILLSDHQSHDPALNSLEAKESKVLKTQLGLPQTQLWELTLPPGNNAVMEHRGSDTHILYVIEGQGVLRYRREGQEEHFSLTAGSTITLRKGSRLNFNNSSPHPLKLLAFSLPDPAAKLPSEE